MKTTLRAAIFGGAVLGAAAVQAGSLTLQETLGTFNLVTQSYSGTQEVEGRTFIGSTLSGVTGQFGFVDPGDGKDLAELYVQGNLFNSTINLAGGGDRAEISGTSTNARVNNGALVTGSMNLPDFDFAQFEQEALGLAALPGTAANLSDQNNKKFGGSGIVTVSGNALSTGGYSFDFGSESHLIINVSGTNITFGMNPLGATKSQASRVIWNFYEATTLRVNSVIAGHMLAPLAAASGFSGSSEGTLIAKSVNLTNGELHQLAWTGEVPLETTVVPLPAGIVLLLGDLGGLAAIRKLRAA